MIATRRGRGARAALLCALAFSVAALPACVTRKLQLRSDPPGARLMLDGSVVGTTPYEEEFPAYGRRRVEAELPGHARAVGTIEIERPWWAYVPFDVFAEFLWPFEIVDEHAFEVRLQPVDPEAATWDDARAAHARLQEFRVRRLGGG